MKSKLWLVVAAVFGLTIMGLQGCLYSSPYPSYGYGYGSGSLNYYQGPAYRSYGSTIGSCNPRNDTCMVCDSYGHHCHPVRD
jgi:hypothetical protein